jgi:hypothetical protein
MVKHTSSYAAVAVVLALLGGAMTDKAHAQKLVTEWGPRSEAALRADESREAAVQGRTSKTVATGTGMAGTAVGLGGIFWGISCKTLGLGCPHSR